MINKKYLKNLRSKEINNKNDFIFDLYNERIIDSLEIINLNFKEILIIGDHGIKLREFIIQKYINASFTIYDLEKNNFDIDEWNYESNKKKYDLIISNFFLFLSDKIDNILKKIMFSLAPNGFFIATLPAEDNFKTLKLAMIKTDTELYSGAFNRFNNFLELTKIIDLLKKNDFKIPLVNLENINLEYKKFDKLLNDIRSMNLSYYNKDKKQIFEKKCYFKKLESNFKKNLNKNFSISTNFYIISGWKDHKSQQKPLKPGKAKNKLKDFL
jgi:SAM-dependent methyltransferase